MRSLVLLIGSACLSVLSVQATPVSVNLVFAELPPNATQVPLPFLLDGINDTLFLKFKIPNIALIETINSFNINVTVYDDGDPGGETGKIQFALPGTNLTLADFAPNLNGTTSSSPVTLSDSLSASDIAEVFPSILDGSFRVRVQRDSGDFFVAGGTAFIDATLVPEPSSLFSMIGGLLVVTACFRRRLPEPKHPAK
jgi:hypothetical protein